MFIIPKNGLLVPNPENNHKPLKVDGEAVSDSRYWQRRIKDGDVTVGKATKSKK